MSKVNIPVPYEYDVYHDMRSLYYSLNVLYSLIWYQNILHWWDGSHKRKLYRYIHNSTFGSSPIRGHFSACEVWRQSVWLCYYISCFEEKRTRMATWLTIPGKYLSVSMKYQTKLSPPIEFAKIWNVYILHMWNYEIFMYFQDYKHTNKNMRMTLIEGKILVK